jgi:UrcA family protein
MMSRTTSKLIHITAALLAAASQVHAAAPAQLNPDTHSMIVHFADLNLDRPAGIATLYRRLNTAAERDCGEPRLTGSHVISSDWQNCVSKAVNQAVLALDRPAVTAYHRAQTRQSDPNGTLAHR